MFRATVEDLAYILGRIRAELPNNSILILNYSYQYQQYCYIRALTTNYYSAVKAAKHITINIAADKLNNIGLEEGLATAQANKDQEANNIDTNIIYIDEATLIKLKNAEQLSRLLSNSKY